MDQTFHSRNNRELIGPNLQNLSNGSNSDWAKYLGKDLSNGSDFSF